MWRWQVRWLCLTADVGAVPPEIDAQWLPHLAHGRSLYPFATRGHGVVSEEYLTLKPIPAVQ